MWPSGDSNKGPPLSGWTQLHFYDPRKPQSKENQDGHGKGLYPSPALVPGCSLLGRGEVVPFYKEGAALELEKMLRPQFPVSGPSREEASRHLLNYHGWAASVIKTTREGPSGSWL